MIYERRRIVHQPAGFVADFERALFCSPFELRLDDEQAHRPQVESDQLRQSLRKQLEYYFSKGKSRS